MDSKPAGSGRSGHPHVRRILLAFDRSHRGRSAAATAVQLATILEAELAGLFIEDENLFRTADLPFTQELGLFSRRARPMERSAIEQSLRREAREMEELLRTLSDPVSVQYTFRVARGLVHSELERHRSPGDIVVFGKAPRLRAPRVAPPKSRRIAVFFDGEDGAQQALNLALLLAQESQSPILVVTPPHILMPTIELTVPAEHTIAGDLLHILVQGLAHRASMLVLPDEGRLGNPEIIARLANELEIPILLV